MSDFGRQADGTEADWDDIELELECSGREAGISGVTFGAMPSSASPWPSAPWPDARWPFVRRNLT